MCTWSLVPVPSSFRPLPWVPFARFCYLLAGAYGVVRVGTGSPTLLLTALVPLLPVLLHLSLVVPRRRPVTVHRPYILRWIYGAPLMAIAIPAVLRTFEPAMGGYLGYHFAFTLQAIIFKSSAAAQFALAAGCSWLAVLPAIEFSRAIRKEGWEGLFSRPATALFTLLCVPVSAGLGVYYFSLAFGLPVAVPEIARTLSLGIVQAAGLAATATIMVLFPVAICVSLFRNCRSLVWQTS